MKDENEKNNITFEYQPGFWGLFIFLSIIVVGALIVFSLRPDWGTRALLLGIRWSYVAVVSIVVTVFTYKKLVVIINKFLRKQEEVPKSMHEYLRIIKKGSIYLTIFVIPLFWFSEVLSFHHFFTSALFGFLLAPALLILLSMAQIIFHAESRRNISMMLVFRLNRDMRESYKLIEAGNYACAQKKLEKLILTLADDKHLEKRMICFEMLSLCYSNLGEFLAMQAILDIVIEIPRREHIVFLFHQRLVAAYINANESDKSMLMYQFKKMKQYANDNIEQIAKFVTLVTNERTLKGSEAIAKIIAETELLLQT